MSGDGWRRSLSSRIFFLHISTDCSTKRCRKPLFFASLQSGTTRNRTMRSSVCISLNWISAKGTVSRGCSTEKPHHFAGFHGVDFLLLCKDNLLFWETNRCPPILLHLEKESNNFSCFLTASYGCCSPFGASKSSWDRCIQSLFPVKLLEILLSHSATGWDRSRVLCGSGAQT